MSAILAAVLSLFIPIHSAAVLLPHGCYIQPNDRHENYTDLLCEEADLIGGMPQQIRDHYEVFFDNTYIPVIPYLDYQNVRHLLLSDCNVTTITDSAFSSMKTLRVLMVVGSHVTSISSHTFAGLSGLSELLFSRNQLQTLPRNSISHRNLPNLTYADFSCGNISSVDAGAFQCMEQLQWLNLSRNALSSDSGQLDFISFMLGLRALDLSYNRITSLKHRPFRTNGNLEQLVLRGNSIQTIDAEDFTGLEHLRNVMLDGNRIHTVEFDAFLPLQSLQEIHLESNNLQVLQRNQFPSQQLKRLHLHDNPWHCGCEIMWFPSNPWIQDGWNYDSGFNMTCSSPEYLAGRKIQQLQAAEFVCSTSKTSASTGSSQLTVLLAMIGCSICVMLTCMGSVMLYRYVLRGKLCFGGGQGSVNSYSLMNNTKGMILMEEDPQRI